MASKLVAEIEAMPTVKELKEQIEAAKAEIEATPTVKELKEQIEAAKAKMREHGEAALKTAFKEFFEKNRKVGAVRWTQYTPYFNDGEACEFGVNGFQVRFADKSLLTEKELSSFYTYDDDDEESFYETSYQAGSELSAAVKDFEREVKDDELFLFTFDDHVQVTATRDGFEVEEYCHD